MNPVLINLFGFDIKWYSVLILVGVIIAIIMVIREGKRFNIPKDFSFNLCFWCIIFGLIGARLYYCIFRFDKVYKNDLLNIFKIWEGGLAIHGAIIGGLITLVIYCKRYNINPFKMTDIAVVPLLFAQAIGRWGNFFNGEAYGKEESIYRLRSLHIPEGIIQGMKINGVYHHPTFFYESIYCLVGFIILLFLRRYKYIKRGQLTALYLIYYGIGRIFIEMLRTDALKIWGFKVAYIVSGIMIFVGLVLFMILSRKGRFEDLYNEEVKGRINF